MTKVNRGNFWTANRCLSLLGIDGANITGFFLVVKAMPEASQLLSSFFERNLSTQSWSITATNILPKKQKTYNIFMRGNSWYKLHSIRGKNTNPVLFLFACWKKKLESTHKLNLLIKWNISCVSLVYLSFHFCIPSGYFETLKRRQMLEVKRSFF